MAHPVLGSPFGGSPDAAGRAFTRFQQLDLDRQLGTSVWLARADGDLVTARVATAAAFDPDSEGRDVGHERTAALAALDLSHVVPLVGVASRGGATWLVSEYVEGVTLSRLIGAATLTPVQAAYIAVRTLHGVAGLHQAGACHGRLTGGNVLIGTDGEPRLTDWAPASLAEARGFDDNTAWDLHCARRLAADLADNADRPVVHHSGRFNGLMAELEQVSIDEDADAGASADRLEQALLDAVGDATSMAGTRTEIGALVSTLVRRSSPHVPAGGTPKPTPKPAPVPVPEMLPSGRLSEADWHRTRRRAWLRPGIAVLVVATLVAGGYLFAREPAADLLDWVLNRGEERSAGPSPRTQHTPTPAEPSTAPADQTPGKVPVLGPAQAGAVTGVSLRPLAACSPGDTCLLRVTARITPATTSRDVVMQVRVANRCTGALRTVATETVSAQPGWTSVFATSQVRLPKAGSLAAVAVTTAPARAASPPLLVPATGGSC